MSWNQTVMIQINNSEKKLVCCPTNGLAKHQSLILLVFSNAFWIDKASSAEINGSPLLLRLRHLHENFEGLLSLYVRIVVAWIYLIIIQSGR